MTTAAAPGEMRRQRDSKYFRILSFDGGPSGLIQLQMLRALVGEVPDLLARADLFAGTSFGALIALSLASRTPAELTDGPAVIDELVDKLVTVFDAYGVGASGIGRLMLGQTATSKRRLAAVTAAIQTELGLAESLTLGDLPRHVCVVSFDLRTHGITLAGNARRPYGPKIFTNIELTRDPGDHEPDLDQPVVEVALRSGAMPILMPIVDGHVDGAMFGNNPTMCAASAVLAHSRSTRKLQREGKQGLYDPLVTGPDDLLCLSMGGDDQRLAGALEEAQLRRSRLPWGALRWLTDLFEPMLLMRLLVASDGRGVDFQLRAVLGPNRSCRIVPLPIAGALTGAFGDAMTAGGAEAAKLGARSAAVWKARDEDYEDAAAPAAPRGLLSALAAARAPIRSWPTLGLAAARTTLGLSSTSARTLPAIALGARRLKKSMASYVVPRTSDGEPDRDLLFDSLIAAVAADPELSAAVRRFGFLQLLYFDWLLSSLDRVTGKNVGERQREEIVQRVEGPDGAAWDRIVRRAQVKPSQAAILATFLEAFSGGSATGGVQRGALDLKAPPGDAVSAIIGDWTSSLFWAKELWAGTDANADAELQRLG